MGSKVTLKNSSNVELSIEHNDLLTKGKKVTYADTIEQLEQLEGLDDYICIVTDKDRGGIFIYDKNKKDMNDSGVVFNGWCRQHEGPVNVKWFTNIENAFLYKTIIIEKDITIKSTINISSSTTLHLLNNSTITTNGQTLFINNSKLTINGGTITSTDFLDTCIVNNNELYLNNVVFKDFVSNSAPAEIYIIKNNRNTICMVENCTFQDITSIDLDEAVGGNGFVGAIYFYNDSSTDGINIDSNISNCKFERIKTLPKDENNLASYYSDANAIRIYSSYSEDDKNKYDSLKLTITGCSFIDNNQMNIKMSNCGGIIVEGNHIINTGNEAFTGENSYKLGFEFRGGSVICNNNTFKDIKSAIVVNGKDGYNRVLNGNTIFTDFTAISISCDNTIVSNNKVYGNKEDNSYTEQATIILEGFNLYFDNGGIVENVSITDNIFQKASVYLGNISSCVIKDNLLYGILNVKRLSNSTIDFTIINDYLALNSFTAGTHYIDNCDLNLNVRLNSLEEDNTCRSIKLYYITNSNINVNAVYHSNIDMDTNAYFIDIQNGDNNKINLNVKGNTDITFTEAIRLNSANSNYDIIRVFKDDSTVLQIQEQDNIIIDNYWDNLQSGTTNIKNYSPSLYINTLNSEGGGISNGSDANVYIGNNYYRGISRIKGSNFKFTDLPTEDPNAEGQLWNDNGTVKISAG